MSATPYRTARPGRCSRRMTRLPWLAAALMAGTAHAGVYTWTDSEGNVHFSDSPPPDARAESAGGERRGPGRNARGRDLADRWHGHSRGRQLDLELDDDGSYVLIESSYAVHSGDWSYEPPVLKLRILSFANDPGRDIETREYRVIDFTATRLRLQDPDKRIHQYVRRVRRERLSADERRIAGRWRIRGTDRVLSLGRDGTFGYVGPDRYDRPPYEGNWYRRGRTVILEHTRGRRDGRIMAGRSVHYRIEFIDGQSLWLQARDGDRRLEMQREVAPGD